MDSNDIFDAFKAAQAREVFPTDLGSDELRDLSAGVRARSVFTARGTNAIFASKLKELIEKLSAGDIGESEVRVTLLETLRALNYTPEGGFPGDAGVVPSAVRGSLQDLSSFRRLDLIVRTQIDLMTGAGQQLRGLKPQRLALNPCWELVRMVPVRVPRDWKKRWEEVGGKLYEGRMIAPKGDSIWGELGSSFDDSLDVDYPPFAFNSGMGWREVSAETATTLGVTSSDGKPWEEFIGGIERPRVLAGQLPLPTPKLQMKNVDPEVLKRLEAEVKTFTKPDGSLDFDDILAAGLKEAAEAYEKQ
jgi:hypothetical protein